MQREIRREGKRRGTEVEGEVDDGKEGKERHMKATGYLKKAKLNISVHT